MVSRRDVLSTLSGSALITSAGCLGGGDSFNQYDVTIRADGLPDEIDEMFEFDVTLIQEFTPELPARIRTTLALLEADGMNANSTRTVQMGETPPFSEYGGWDSESGGRIVVLPDETDHIHAEGRVKSEEFVPEEPSNGCWDSIGHPYPPERHEINAFELSPGDELSNEYVVLGDSGPCPENGTYEFSSDEPYRVLADDTELVHRYSDVSLDFSITLSR